jgi:hypothetical protein
VTKNIVRTCDLAFDVVGTIDYDCLELVQAGVRINMHKMCGAG